MNPPIDPICDADLNAYVDGQLEMRRRIAVEDHLARHPGMAAQVMADLRSRDELRLAFADPPARPRLEVVDAARRLERGLARARIVPDLRRVAAVAALIAAGWFAHAQLGPLSIGASAAPPAFVEDAASSYRSALSRAAMHARHPADARYDSGAIRATTAIALPELPDEWRVLDVEISPSAHGPSVEMAIAAGANLGTLSLFAVRPGDFDVVSPTVAEKGSEAVAYWQIGETAYALTGAAGDDDRLNRAALQLSESLY
jgi:anti-sigma factor RsiW